MPVIDQCVNILLRGLIEGNNGEGRDATSDRECLEVCSTAVLPGHCDFALQMEKRNFVGADVYNRSDVGNLRPKELRRRAAAAQYFDARRTDFR